MASETKDTINLGLNYKDFIDGLSNVNAQIRTLDNAYKLNKEQLKNLGDENSKVANTIGYLQQRIELQSKKVEESKKAYDEALNSENATEAQLSRLQNAYIRNQTELASLNNSLNSAQEEMNSLNESVDSQTSAFNNNAESLTAYNEGLGLIEKGLKYAKQGMEDFLTVDQNMSKVSTIADLNIVSLKNLREGVYDISDVSSKSAEDISNALYQAISSNIKTADSLSFVRKSAVLAKTGFTDTSTAVDILSSIMNTYGYSINDVDTIINQLIKTQKKGKLTIDELGNGLGNTIGLAKQAGVPLNELMSTVATLTQSGMSADNAFTSIKATLSNIISPTSEASKTAKQLGIDFSASALQGKGFTEFMQEIQEKCGGNVEKMAKLFGSVKAVNAVLQLTSDEGMKAYTESLGEITNSNGASDEALKNMDSTSGRFNKSLNKLQLALIKLGDALSPIIDFASTLISFVANIPTPLLVVITVLGVLTLVINSLTKAQTLFASIQALCSISMGIFTGATEITTASLAKLLIVILAIVAVVALLIGGWKSITKAIKEAKEAGDSLSTAQGQATQITDQQARIVTKSTGVKYNASGTDDFEGGETWVGEGGPEKIRLPRHSQILTNEESKGKGNTYYNITIDAKNVKEFNDVVNMCRNKKQVERRGINTL